MSEESIQLVYAMAALVFWTFLVMLRNIQVRVRAVMRGELTNEYFELFAGAEPSTTVVKTGNHLRNLFEFPLLFYVVCLAVIVTAGSDAAFGLLAWSYVGLRAGHSIVHLTVNRVPARFLFFALSNIVLFIMWFRLATQW